MSSGYGLTKPVKPKSKDQETGVRPKRQDVIFTATPTPIKWVIQWKSHIHWKRSMETEKINNYERIPIKENKESSRSNDKNATMSVTNKFQQ